MTQSLANTAAASTKKIDAAHIPQANNIFSLKKLLGLFSTDVSVLASADAMVLFDEKRALDYYTNAASKTLGWMESAGTDDKAWVLTPLGKTLHSSLSEESTFCRLAHQSLLSNAYYQVIHANPGSAQAREELAQQLVDDTDMELSTARRRASTWASWHDDLNAGMQGNTKKLVSVRLRSRTDKDKKTLVRAFDAAKPLFREQVTQVRTFQSGFRAACMEVHGSRCVLTGVDDPIMLVASHIKPVRACNGAKEACDPLNGLVLETRFDRLFDQGLITFESDGSMRISPQLSPNYIRATKLDTTLKLGDLHPDTKSYLVYHRKCVFQKSASDAAAGAPSIVDVLADTFAGATASESVALA